MKKSFFRLMLAVLLLCFVLASHIAVADSVRSPLAIDMLLVIENSTDMNTAYGANPKSRIDPNGLRFEAAAALIGMCDTQYARASYFLFNKDLYLYSEDKTGNVMKVSPEEITLYNISVPANRNVRQRLIDQLTGDKIRGGHGTKAGTDIGKALEAAVNVQLRDNNGNRKVILLLSTGRISGVEKEVSRAAALQAKEKAVENDIEIYTVSLKDNSAGELMQQLATGVNNYQFAANAEDLTDVFRNFFADMIGSDPMESKAVQQENGDSVIRLDIPNDSVSEVNVILPTSNISEPKLFNSEGNLLNVSSDDLIITQSRNFISYKIIKPDSDTYRLVYQATGNRDAVIQYVFSYGVQAEAQVSKSTFNKHESVTVTAQYTEEGDPTKDQKLYKIPATLILRKDGRMKEEVAMNTTDTGYNYTFERLDQYGTGEYTAEIHFEGDGLLRNSGLLQFALINNAPEFINANETGDSVQKTINIPKDASSYGIQSFEWDLSKFVKDINGDAMKAEITSNGTATDARIENDMKLIVKTRKDAATEGDINVVVQDAEGAASPDVRFHVKVTNFEDKYKEYTGRFDPVVGIEKNSTCGLTLRLYDKNQQEIRDDDQVPSIIQATLSHDGLKEDLTLTKGTGSVWTGKFQTGEKAFDYNVKAQIKIGQITVPVEELTIKSGNQAPTLRSGATDRMEWEVQINDPSKENTYEVQEHTWNLTDYIEDKNGDPLVFSVDKDATNAAVDAGINKEDHTLTIKTRLNQETDGNVVVWCEDNDREKGPVLTFHVHVVSQEEKYRAYTADLDSDGHGKSRHTLITLTVKDEDGLLVTGDTNLPDEIDATVVLDNTSSPMHMVRGEDGKWTGSIDTVNETAIYQISAKIPVSRNVDIIAPDLKLNTENTAPIVKAQISESGMIPQTISIEPFLIWSQETGPIVLEDLNEYFQDADGDQLVFSVQTDSLNGAAEAVLEGNSLRLNGISETSSPVKFTVSATDNEGASITSDPISFEVKSLKKQGIIILAAIAAAIVLLLIVIQIAKPAFHGVYFEVFTRSVGQNQDVPQGKSGVLQGKNSRKLMDFATASAKQVIRDQFSSDTLGRIELKPAYGNGVKVKVGDVKDTAVYIGNNKVPIGKSKTLATNGTLRLERNGINILFKLQRPNGSGAPTAPEQKHVEPVRQPATQTPPRRTTRM